LSEKTITVAAHDEYLRIAVELGYPGAFLFFALTVAIFLTVWNSTWVRRDPIFLVCVVAFYVYCLTDNAISAATDVLILTAASFACQRRSPTTPSVTSVHPKQQRLPVPADLTGHL
jgi:O-antigen ligase